MQTTGSLRDYLEQRIIDLLNFSKITPWGSIFRDKAQVMINRVHRFMAGGLRPNILSL